MGTPAIEELKICLGNPDVEVRKVAARALGRIGVSEHDIESGLGNYSMAEVRTAFLIGSWGTSGNWRVDRLVSSISDPDALVRKIAMDTICDEWSARGPRAVEPLIVALKDPDLSVQEAAARALGCLGEISGARGVESLLPLLTDGQSSTRDQLRSVTLGALAQFGRPAVNPLLGILRDDPSDEVRREVARAIADILVHKEEARKESKLVERLVSALDDPSVRVRVAVAQALVKTDDKLAHKRLLTAFRDKDLALIAGGSRFFIERGESGTETILIEALNAGGDSATAIDFMNSGNSRLKSAGESWARENGYMIVQQQVFVFGGRKAWGSRKK